MNIDGLSAELGNLMEKETGLLNEICREEEKIQQALRDNNWDEMEIVINKLMPLSVLMERTEAERDKIFRKMKSKLKKSDEDGFYAVAAHMKGENRENCLSGYRKMKIALLKMQGITAAIDHYVRTVGNTGRAVLNEVFPHRRGRLYSADGVERPLQSDPMVLNRHL